MHRQRLARRHSREPSRLPEPLYGGVLASVAARVFKLTLNTLNFEDYNAINGGSSHIRLYNSGWILAISMEKVMLCRRKHGC